MDTLISMSLFCRVAEAESFTAVARESGLSQSTVSKHVAALEVRLGTKLFNRSTRQLSLTEAGSEYYGYCVRILEECSEAEANIGKGQNRPRGTLRVTASAPFGRMFIVPFLWEFLDRYPELRIDLVLEDRYVDLVKEGIDLAIRVGPMSDSTLVASPVGVSSRVAVASPQYLEHNGVPHRPADLSDHECLTYSLQKTPGQWFFNGPEGEEQVQVCGRMQATSPEVLGDAALAGLGIALMCEWVVRPHIDAGRLRTVLPGYEAAALEVNAVYPERRFVPLKVRCLLDHLRACFRAKTAARSPC